MKAIRAWLNRYPYRGLFGWATICVWGFTLAGLLWHASAFVRRYDLLEIPMIVPYAPLAMLLDPHDAMLHHRHVYFVALANWVGIFLLGAAFACRKRSAAVVGSLMLGLVLSVAFSRVVAALIFPPPIGVCWLNPFPVAATAASTGKASRQRQANS